ncbi:hypothetical protein ACFLRM_02065 [Acidobacteriota bacterium]
MIVKKKIRHVFLKTNILQFFYSHIWKTRFVSVPIEQLRCQQKPFSEILGFAGKTIQHFPPCKFFQMFLINPEIAYKTFFDWLHECLINKQAHRVPISDGGWQNSALVRTISELHRKNKIDMPSIDDADMHLLKKAIHNYVQHNFRIFKSIKNEGYNRRLYPPIYCSLKGSYYYIENGHRRVSALWALGYSHVIVALKK